MVLQSSVLNGCPDVKAGDANMARTIDDLEPSRRRSPRPNKNLGQRRSGDNDLVLILGERLNEELTRS